jgi:ornithine cyclodeaminase
MIGWGPIGRRHMEMLIALFGEELESVRLYDLKGIDSAQLDPRLRSNTHIASSWQEVYRNSDIVFTCTSSTERYIDESPPPGTLLMNVSLREYLPESLSSVKTIVVDNWREVCRENTDIEQLHARMGLTEAETVTLREVVYGEALQSVAPSEPIFFAPMGMAAFDMTLAAYYWREAERLGIGVRLDV